MRLLRIVILWLVAQVSLSVAEFSAAFSAERLLDEFAGGVQTSELEAWFNAKIDAAHTVQSLVYGKGGWVIFASDNYAPKEPSAVEENASIDPGSRFKIGDKAEVFSWITDTLKFKTWSFTSVAYGGGSWVAWADPNLINAGELHGAFDTLSQFSEWIELNIELGCFPTTITYGDGTYYGVCKPKLGPLHGAPDSDAKVESLFAVLTNPEETFEYINSHGEKGYSLVTIAAADSQWIVYMEKKKLKDTWVMIRNNGKIQDLVDWVSQYSEGSATNYDLAAVAYGFPDGAWFAWMSSVDADEVARQRLCSAGCPQSWVGDGVCDSPCKNDACWQDAGDCGEIDPNAPYFGNITIVGEEHCVPGCPLRIKGDNQCDSACMVEECDFDDGDCECAPGCDYFNMVDDGTCQKECNVESCAYDGDDCSALSAVPEWYQATKQRTTAQGAKNGESVPFIAVDSQGMTDAYSELDPGLLNLINAAIDSAVKKWNEVLMGEFEKIKFSPGNDEGYTVRCRSASKTFKEGEFMGSSILVMIVPSIIDGPSSTRARAAPCVYDRESLMPRVGAVEVDTEDIQSMIDDQVLDRVIMHEIGHILGIGSLWARHKLISDAGSLDPRYNGVNGRAGLLRIGAKGLPQVANVGGRGTYASHWRDSVFGRELMTGSLSSGEQPMSALTLYALRDLGYIVNTKDGMEELSLPKYKHQDKIRSAAGTYGNDLIEESEVTRVIDLNGVIYSRFPDGTEVRENEGRIPGSSIALMVIGFLLVGFLLVEGYIRKKRIENGEIEAEKVGTTALSSRNDGELPSGPRWI